jgi:hypothetical protein
MYAVRGTPVTINGRTGGTPGPATTTALRVPMPVPPGRQKVTPSGGQPLAPSTTYARYLRVRNLDATNNLLVSFASGDPVTVVKGAEEEFSGEVPWIVVQAVASTVQWEVFAVVAS